MFMLHLKQSESQQAGFVVEVDRKALEHYASAAAQASFQQGNAAWEEGAYSLAWNWLERANRQARDNPHVMFALVLAREAVGQTEQALELLDKLLEKFDFREGWSLLATLKQTHGAGYQALHAIRHLLAYYACTPDVEKLAQVITRLNGVTHWWGVRSNGQIIGAGLPKTALQLVVDGKVRKATRKKEKWFCPSGWQQAHTLCIITDQGNIFPNGGLYPQQIVQCEGIVDVGEKGLTGWVWLPRDSDTVPVLEILDAQTNKKILTFHAESFCDSVSSEKPLARYRVLNIPFTALPDGPVRIVGPDGKDLAGSPINPTMMRCAASEIAHYVAAQTKEEASAYKHVVLPELIPIPVTAERNTIPKVSGGQAETVVIIPVFKNTPCTLACLKSVRASLKGTSVPQVWVVNDASPEPDLVSSVIAFCKQAGFRYLERAHNGGFPCAVNEALRHIDTHDVVLLNSDTLVPAGWLAALRKLAYHAADTGTVTPFSNDASIFSYPDKKGTNPLPDQEETEQFMQLAQAANAGRTVEVPTAHGFCMYIRHDCLQQTGLLREDLFAQGYGEENDFCMRARALGWKHMAATGVFVAHVGSSSFGESGSPLMQRNQKVLEQLHPGYHELIARWIATDPLFPERRRFDLVRFRNDRAEDVSDQAVLLVTHAVGGGVEKVVQERVAFWCHQKVRPLILRPSEQGYVLEDGGSQQKYPSLCFAFGKDMPLLRRLLHAEGVERIEIHQVAGHDQEVMRLPAHLKCKYEVFVHDYIWFCPRISLMGLEKRYCGEPDVAVCNVCVAMLGRRVDDTSSIVDYRKTAHVFLQKADQVFVPSHDAARRMRKYFPDISFSVHELEKDSLLKKQFHIPKPIDRNKALASAFFAQGLKRVEPRVRVCVVGGIGPEKGYDILLEAGVDAALRNLPLEFVVVGHTSDDAALLKTGRIFVTGEFRKEEVVSLIHAVDADIAFLPSVWPETWCFALGDIWKAGLHVVAFDLGAPAERIRATGLGEVLALDISIQELNKKLLVKGKEMERKRRLSSP
ncbi:glycosyl transferase [Acetobacter pomorum]|uniref:Glycosyl transferase n=2 Tax=Acetobacter pomorum TaxID=65959 RepID=A0A2G4RHB2_9PROT|nr:glycosyltransferase [Acetobacter pomorum]PHY95135.1 glycosyl transferase [Acetobacter pomorum]